MRRGLVRRACTVAVLTVAIGASWAPRAAVADIFFTMNPTAGPPGTVVSVSGQGCSSALLPGPDVVRVLPGTQAAVEIGAAGNGSWSGSFTVAADAPAIPMTITALCLHGGLPSATTIYVPQVFTVTAPGTTTTSPPTTSAPTTTTGGAGTTTTTTKGTTTTKPGGSSTTAAPGGGANPSGPGSGASGGTSGSGSNSGNGSNSGRGASATDSAGGRGEGSNAGGLTRAERSLAGDPIRGRAGSDGTSWLMWLVVAALVLTAFGLLAARVILGRLWSKDGVAAAAPAPGSPLDVLRRTGDHSPRVGAFLAERLRRSRTPMP